ncbi:MAG: polysaccharide pyruvyl transferase family protein [Pseudomonadota bacterium]
MSSPLTIGLIGHSTKSDNLGVGALTVAEIEIVRALAVELGTPLKFLVFDWRNSRKSFVFGDDIELIEMSGKSIANPFLYFRNLLRTSMVIDIGGGDSFADIYGPGRLVKILLMKYQVHLAGKPLVLAPQTFGPFKSGWSRFLAKPHIRLAKSAFSRDHLSMDAMRGLGLGDEIELASDVALKLPYSKPDFEGPNSKTKVGLNVSGLLMSGGYNQKNQFGLKVDYPELISELITQFLELDECELHLVPHVLSPDQEIEDDYRACVRLNEQFPETVLAPEFETPSDAKSYIANMDFFMGARMHSCIAAFSSGVPVVPMAYSRKFEGMFGALGYEHTVDCVEGENEALVRTIMNAFGNREQIKTDVSVALNEGKTRLACYEDAIRALIQELSSR